MSTILTSDERPMLPSPVYGPDNQVDEDSDGAYTADQMEAYADAREAAVLAKLAQQADRQRVPDGWRETVEAAREALETCINFIEDAHIIDGQWSWEPNKRASTAMTQLDGLLAAAPEAPAQRKKVGDSRFESWFSEDFDPKNKGTKQQMREAYEAGMNDSAPEAPAQASAVDERGLCQLTDELAKTVALLRQAWAVIRWQCFGECRTEGVDGLPTPSEIDAAIREHLNKSKQ